MKQKTRKELPYFGYGKKVVLLLTLCFVSWIFGLLYFGIDFDSRISFLWLLSPLLCVFSLGVYSLISISVSLFQFSNVTKGGADLAEDILRAKKNLSGRGFKLDD
ncbi:hypothetical protein FG379_001965 [Cryptosporidium bovis]|uniref:uncharacterized protein n=1 Tax=Cryptosporidium bovis TaxID=310047 RepID=UPI00351A2E99|nr:hypothetical protein FG379_001965 [Cryptosporidium bovis]